MFLSFFFLSAPSRNLALRFIKAQAMNLFPLKPPPATAASMSQTITSPLAICEKDFLGENFCSANERRQFKAGWDWHSLNGMGWTQPLQTLSVMKVGSTLWKINDFYCTLLFSFSEFSSLNRNNSREMKSISMKFNEITRMSSLYKKFIWIHCFWTRGYACL